MTTVLLDSQTLADVGNSSAKIIFTSRGRRTTRTIYTIINKLLSLPEYVEDKPLEQLLKNLHEDLIVEIDSPAVAQNGIYAIGSKAFTVKDGVTSTFDINDVSKHEHDISIILPTALIATNAIQEHFETHEELPAELTVKVDYRTALPLKKFSQERVDILKKRLLTGTHKVRIRVRGDFIPVNVEYTNTVIVQEGLPTIYALVLIPKLLEKFEISADALMKKNVLSLDIGEGTTEGNYLTHSQIDSDLSDGDVRGVGHAATRAIKQYTDAIDIGDDLSRQEFMRVIRDESHSKHTLAKKYLDEANKDESYRILEFVKARYKHLKGNIDIIVVSGGGATVFRTYLEPLLKAYCEPKGIQILWMDAEYADMMNCLGLGAMLQQEQQEQEQEQQETV